MPNSRYYSSTAAATNLQVTVSPSDASMQVASSVGWPSSFPFIVSLDYGSSGEELVLVTNGGPSVFNITRAYDGTSATTHNAGAVVRHVSAAIDFTDSRTHEASTTNVHGITGQFVDTLSTQTLSNKTLNNPTINGATVSGTVAGGTYTGATLTSPTITGPTITGTVAGAASHSGVQTFSAGLVAEGETIQKPNGTDIAQTIKRDADTTGRLNTTADGAMSWGPGGSGATDVTLSRSGAGALSLSGSLVSGPITSSGLVTGTDLSLTSQNWTSFTPSWNGTDANFATNIGYYWKIGKIVHYEIYTVWSSSSTGSANVSVNMPSTPYRGTSPLIRQILGVAWFDNLATGSAIANGTSGPVWTFASDSGATSASLRDYKGSIFTAGLIQGPSPGTTVTIQGWYREA
jgi:hypothetical protein